MASRSQRTTPAPRGLRATVRAMKNGARWLWVRRRPSTVSPDLMAFVAYRVPTTAGIAKLPGDDGRVEAGHVTPPSVGDGWPLPCASRHVVRRGHAGHQHLPRPHGVRASFAVRATAPRKTRHFISPVMRRSPRGPELLFVSSDELLVPLPSALCRSRCLTAPRG